MEFNNEAFVNNIKGIYDAIQKHDIDWVLVNTGEEGSGKSSTSLWILKILGQTKLKEHIAFNFEQYTKLSKKHAYKKGHVIILDEAGSSFFSREAQKKFNKLLVKWLMFNRSFFQFHILNIPNFYYLDKYVREQRVKSLLFHVFDLKHEARFGAFYRRSQIVELIHPKKHIMYRTWMLKGTEFIRRFKPTFLYRTPFEEIREMWDEYSKLKKEFQEEYAMEVELEMLKKVKDEDAYRFIRKVKENQKLKDYFYILYLLMELEGEMTWLKLFNFKNSERYKILSDVLKVRNALAYLERLGLIKFKKGSFIKIEITDPVVYYVLKMIEEEENKIRKEILKQKWNVEVSDEEVEEEMEKTLNHWFPE